MNLQYTTEQNLLRESAGKFLSARYDYPHHQKICASELGWSAEIWAEFAQLGWLGLPFSEDLGGSGGGAIEIALLMEAFGARLVLEPYVPTVLLGGGLVAALGSREQRNSLLGALIDGRMQLAFAHQDGAAAVTAKRSGSNYVISGTKKAVLGAPGADQLLVSVGLSDDATGVIVLPKSARGLALRTYPMVHGSRAADLDLDDVSVPASALLGANEDAGASIAYVIDRAIAALSADAVGAIAAMVATTVEYTKTRVQFGQPIARFQALQHRMVDMKVREEEARASCLLAALSLEGSAAQRSRAVSGAKAKIGRCARSVHQAAIQLHGAIGTTNELSLGAYAKRLLAYETLFGSTREHLRRYATIVFDPGVAAAGLLHESAAAAVKGGEMNLELSREDLAFRDRIRAFLDENLTPQTRRAASLTTGFIHDPEIAVVFHRALHRKGWSVPHWPVEHGGTGWTAVERYLFESECARAGAPTYNGAGSHMVGPVIMHFGSEEQKKKYLPRIVSGEDCWAQGYSEPGSGSDLASLRTRAVREGDHYVINGQKIWTTHAHKANRIFALVRTSTGGKKQEGISFLLMDMNLPGITVRPIIGNGGDHEFNEVFFDNVRAPVSGRVGEENKGWEVAKYLLEFERGGNPVAGRVRAQFASLVKQVGEDCRGDPDIAARLGELGTDLDAMEMLELCVLSASQTGVNPGPISSLLKMRWSQIRQQLAEVAMDALGVEALRWIGERPLYETLHLSAGEEELLAVMPRYLNYRAYTILGGTTEIQTGILARALLGL